MPHAFLVSRDYLPNIGGIAAHVHHLSKALEAEGHDVTVLVPSALRRPRYLGMTRSGRIRVIRFPHSGRSHLVEATIAAGVGMAALAHRGQPLILHTHDLWSMRLTERLPGFTARVWTNHSSQFLDAYATEPSMLVKHHERVDGILAVSTELAEASGRIWPETPVRYVPNGVNTDLFRPDPGRVRPASGLLRVLCPRRLVEKNGVVFLAEAAVQLSKTRSSTPIDFVFLGGGQGDEVYEQRVRGTLEDVVPPCTATVLGAVAMSDMPDLYRSAHIVVVPSLVEAVSLAALEAMATRLPVVASAVGGLPTVVKDGITGHLVPPADAAALAEALAQLISAPDERFAMGENGRDLAISQFSWSNVAQRTISFYEELTAV